MIQNPKSQIEKQIDELRKKVAGAGGGTGKWLDNDHTSAAHNDWTNNSSQGKYDSVDGYNNTITGNANVVGANTVGGSNNTLATGQATWLAGDYNSITNAYASLISGYDIEVTSGANCCIISGRSNDIAGAYYSIISGQDNALNIVTKSIVMASNISGTASDTSAGYIQYSAVFGEYNKINSNGYFDYSLAIGNGNEMGNVRYSFVGGHGNTCGSVSDSIVSGTNNTCNSIDGTAVCGHSNTVIAVDAAVFGDSNYVSASYVLACGCYGTTDGLSSPRFIIGNGTSSSNYSNALTVDADGNVNAAGTITPGGADYAEYFEWLDGNPDNEDRRGMLVNLDGDKLIPAHGSEFIGVISANPSVIGNNAEMHWHGKYKTDVFGCIMKDEAGKPIISDDYKKQKYTPRSERPEWGLVGLVGRLVVTDDGSCKVGGYVSARRGIGTSCYTPTNARVLRRIDENHIEALVR